MLGLSPQEWKRLKDIQLEYNVRMSKILDEMEKENDNDSP